jgi:asparagine synthase (glutamine-hydrolysing)
MLKHRGPDQHGVFASDIFSLGAARLKIIDLQTGNQPILENNGEWGIVFNGEIYNHLELRAELESLGHRFSTRSDTETVLKAFRQWDKGSFSRLRGMFALAVWHLPSRRLIIARDRMGIKPLYYTLRGEDLFFGSELKSILIHPEIDRTLSLDGLDCYLSLNYVPSPWTLIEAVKKVPPGEWMEWQDGKTTTGSYWTLPFGNTLNISEADAKAALDSLLRSAVKEQLLSDVPLGVWLSGGVDSTTILHYAAEASSSQLKTFSISFRGRSFDESAAICETVKQYGTDHDQLDLSPEVDLQGAVEEFAYYSDEPMADAGSLPVWFLSKLCKRKTTVALSGEGADELFAGYLTYLANRIARTVRAVPGAAPIGLSLLRLWPVSDEKIGFDYKATRLLQGSLLPSEQAHVFWNGTFAQWQLPGLVTRPLPHALDAVLGQMHQLPRDGDDLAPYLWLDQKYYLADDILAKSDRMSMAHSVEVRPVFLDHRIVEFASRLPSRMKLDGSRLKVILKDLMKSKLPPGATTRPKIGFDIPAHEWLRGILRPMLEDALRFGLTEYGDLFNRAAIERLNAQHQRRRINVGYHLWGLLILFLWMKKWGVRVPPTAVR